MLEIEIDGKQARSVRRQHGDGCGQPGRHLHPAFLLSQETVDRRQLPHVPGAGREGAEAAAGLRDAGDQRHEGVDAFRAGRHRAEGRDGVSADQPSARLPDLRPGRRMPVAGSGGRLRRQRLALRGRQARRRQQEPRAADLDRHDALHPLHALRALRPGNRRHHGTGHDRPRRAFRNHHVRRQDRRFRTVGQRHRSVSGRRADLQAVPLQRAHLGTDAPALGQPALRPGLQPDACRSSRTA